MKNLKMSLNVFLLIFLILSLCACGSSDSDTSENNTAQTEQKSSKKDEKKEEVKEFKVGETWTVPDQWSVTVNKVTETNERNEYSDKKPAAVYIVDYTYSNLGYEDSSGIMNGLFISFDDQIVDCEGTMGYEYPGDQSAYPQETPVGASCKAQAVIGVEHPGIFTVNYSLHGSDSKLHKAIFIMDSSAEAVESNVNNNQVDSSSALKNGETWTVPDQWELTIKGAKKVEANNEYSDKSPGAVYLVDYEYKNLGYQDQSGMMEGLYFDLEDSIVDSEGTMGYSYPGDITDYPQETPVGATCKAQSCIGVDHPGDFIINMIKYDGNGKKQSQSFKVAAE